MTSNRYTARWFDLFLRPINPQQTAREVTFLQRCLPQPYFHTIIDICCGIGRHAHLLALQNYVLTGVDRDAQAIAEARNCALPTETYIQHDMRYLYQLSLRADAVICLWQSFGYFDAATNQNVLRAMTDLLPVAGRCVLDIYHHDFFVEHQGTRTFALGESQISATTQVIDGRLYVRLTEYDAKPIDAFEWQLFTPQECITFAESVGLVCLLACTNFDEQQQPSAALPRVQYVFEKRR
jgi:SAM-dependent methyltransferase